MTGRVEVAAGLGARPCGRPRVHTAVHLGLLTLLAATAATAAGQSGSRRERGPEGPANAAGQEVAPKPDKLLRGLDLDRTSVSYAGSMSKQSWDLAGEKATFHPAEPIAMANCTIDATGPIRLRVPVGRPGALGARTTRVTVVWSVPKSGWAEGAIRVEGPGMQARADNRPTQRAAAGRRLSIDVPAAVILGGRALAVDVAIALRCRGRGSAEMRVDALEIEVLG